MHRYLQDSVRLHSRSHALLRASVVAALWIAPAITQAAQSLESIRSAAESFIRQQIPQVESQSNVKIITAADGLDARLQLNDCASALQAALPSGARIQTRTTVAVSCSAPARWTVYVPVAVESEIQVLVLRQAAARESSLSLGDVEIRRQRVPGVGSLYISDVRQLQGRHLKRPVPAGTLLTAELLIPDILVKRGQQVTLLTALGGIEVRASGKALTEGSVRDRIRVQNLSSQRIIEGTIEAADIVRVGS